MLTLEQFKEWHEPISKYNKDFDDQCDILSRLYPDSFVIPSLGTHLLDNYIKLLSYVVEDDSEWISYYVFECNNGNKPMTVTYSNGKEVVLDSLEKLYNIITSKD